MPDGSSRGARRLAALLTGIQALALTGFAGFYIVELFRGEGSDAVRVLMSAALILIGAGGLVVLARGWLGTGSWPRTPTLVWNALLLPVGYGLAQAGRTVVGWTVILGALVTAVGAWVARGEDAEVLPDSDADRTGNTH